jgi:hypothetical protein
MKLTVSELRFRSMLKAAVGNVISPAEMLEIIACCHEKADSKIGEDEVVDLLEVEIRSGGYSGPSVGKIAVFAVKQYRRIVRMEHQRRQPEGKAKHADT